MFARYHNIFEFELATDRNIYCGEKNSGEILVERGAYVDTKELVERMLNAGDILASQEKLLYDYNKDFKQGDFDEYNVSRDGWSDIVDIQEQQKQVLNSLKEKESKFKSALAEVERKRIEAQILANQQVQTENQTPTNKVGE